MTQPSSAARQDLFYADQQRRKYVLRLFRQNMPQVMHLERTLWRAVRILACAEAAMLIVLGILNRNEMLFWCSIVAAALAIPIIILSLINHGKASHGYLGNLNNQYLHFQNDALVSYADQSKFGQPQENSACRWAVRYEDVTKLEFSKSMMRLRIHCKSLSVQGAIPDASTLPEAMSGNATPPFLDVYLMNENPRRFIERLQLRCGIAILIEGADIPIGEEDFDAIVRLPEGVHDMSLTGWVLMIVVAGFLLAMFVAFLNDQILMRGLEPWL